MPTDPPSILFVLTRGDSIGGAQIHVRDLAAGAKAHGWRVAVALGTPGPLIGMLEEAGVEVLLVPGLARSINPFADLGAIVRLRGMIRQWGPSLVACHTAKAGLVGRLAAWLTGVPSQYTVHGWQFAEGISPLQRMVVLATEKVLGHVTQKIITVSEFDRQLALQHKVAPPERLITIHNGMAGAAAPRAVRNDGSVHLIMVARFQPQKDHGTLLAALQQLEGLPWTLHLVGDGPDLARWQTWVAAQGWNDRVVFHGLSLQVPSLLAQADIFVLATRWEGFPNSILEAMRAGLPVVASNVGGVSEAVVPQQTGLLVPPENPEVLAQALATLIADRQLRLTWGAAGKARFEAEFTFEQMLAKTEKVWRGE